MIFSRRNTRSRTIPAIHPLRRLATDAGTLLSGNLAAALLGLASLAVAARGLSVEDFGLLVLIGAYAAVIDRVFNFQTWQSVIKFGASTKVDKDYKGLKALLSLCFMVDITTAIVASTAAITVALVAASFFSWSSETTYMISVFSLAILFRVTGTPIGILRLNYQFGAISIHSASSALLRLTLFVLVAIQGWGLWGFLIAWALADVVSSLALIYLSLRTAERQNATPSFTSLPRRSSQRFPGFWKFTVTTNIHGSIKLWTREVDILAVGAILGPAAAGIYKVVKSIGTVFSMVTDPLYQAIYPPMAHAYSIGDFKKLQDLLFRPILWLGPVALLALLTFWAIGEAVIVLALGDTYAPSFLPAMVFLIGIAISMMTFSFHPFMLATGNATGSLKILTVSSILYFVFLIPLTFELGLIGSAIAFVIFYCLWAGMQWRSISMSLKHQR